MFIYDLTPVLFPKVARSRRYGENVRCRRRPVCAREPSVYLCDSSGRSCRGERQATASHVIYVHRRVCGREVLTRGP